MLNGKCIAKFDCDTKFISTYQERLEFLPKNEVLFTYHYPRGRQLKTGWRLSLEKGIIRWRLKFLDIKYRIFKRSS